MNTIQVRQTDVAGNVSPAATLAFTLDMTAPTITIHPVSGGYVNDAEDESAVTVSGTTTAEDGQVVTVTLGGKTYTAVAGSGAWSTSVSSEDIKALAEGTVSLTADVSDAAGNAAAQATQSFVYDRTAPALPNITAIDANSGASNDRLTNDATPELTVEAEAGLRLSLGSGGSAVDPSKYTVTEVSPGRYTITVTSDLADAGYGVVAFDAAGNKVSPPQGVPSSASFRIDTVAPSAPPTLALDSESDSGQPGDGITSDTYPWLRVALLADAQVGERVEVFELGEIGTDGEPTVPLGDRLFVVLQQADLDAGFVRIQVGNPLDSEDAVEDGTYQVVARLVDGAGNASGYSAPVELTVDTTAPVAPTVTLEADTGESGTDGITNSGAYTVSGETGATFEYSLDGTTWSTTAPTAAEGANTIQVRQTDVAGNVSPAATLAFTLDTTAPAAPVINAVATDNVVNGAENASLVISGTGEAGATVKLAVTDQTAVVGSDGNWSITVDNAATRFGEGAETLSVTQTDAAGNASVAGTRAITVDTVAPAITSAATAEVAENVGANVLVYTATASDASTVKFSLAGTDAAAFAIDEASGAVTIEASPDFEMKPSYSFTVVATDAAGNASEQAVTLSVSNLDDAGAVIDGYVSGATVSRVNGSGNTVTTDEAGQFNGLTGDGAVQVTGGIDVVTGQPVGFTLRAPDGAAIVSPLTTLVQALIDSGSDETAAYRSVADKFGLTLEQLQSDPWVAGSENLAVIKVAVQVASVLSTAVAQGVDSVLAATTLATKLGAIEGVADLADATFLASVFADSQLELGATADSLAQALAQSNALVHAAESPYEVSQAQSKPMVTVSVSDSALGAGETATVTFTFSERPVGFSLDDVVADNGKLSDLTDSGGLIFTATFTPSRDFEAATNSIRVSTEWADAVDNAPVSGASSANYAIDTKAPVFSSAALVGVNENVASGSAIYTAIAGDAARVSYALEAANADDASLFDIDGVTGVVTIKTSPNYEAKNSYSFTVAATDAAGNASEQAVTLTIGDLNEVAVINSATKDTIGTVLVANAQALGIDLTAFDALVLRKPNALADFLANKPAGGFANEAAAKTVFDAVVAANAASEATLLAANAMTSSAASASVDALVAAETAMLAVFEGLAEKGVGSLSAYPVFLLIGPFDKAVTDLAALGEAGDRAFVEWVVANKGTGFTGLTSLANVSSVAYQKGAFADQGPLVVSLQTDTGAPDGISKDGTVRIDNVFAGASLEYRLSGAATWTKIPSGNSFILPEGQYTAGDVEVRQTLSVLQLPLSSVDAASTPVSLGAVTIDLTPPEAASIVVAGEEGGLNADEATTAVGVAITPDSGATIVSAKIGTTDLTVVGTKAGEYTFDATGLAQGAHTITVVTADAAGNPTVTTRTITIDTVAPAVPTVTAQVTSDLTPLIAGTAPLGSGETLSVTVNGATYDKVDVNGVTGAWSIDTGTATPRAGTTLGAFVDGQTYEIVATVTDAAGNQSADLSIGELQIDVTKPATPTVNALTTNNSEPTITGAAVLEPGETLAVTVGGVRYTTENGLSIDDATWSLTLPELAEISYDVLAVVTDAAGNTTPDVTVGELIIDRTAPTVSIAADASVLRIGGTATITLTFSEAPATLPTVTSSAGELGTPVQDVQNPLVYTATLTLPAGTAGGGLNFSVGDWSDLAGNAGSTSVSPTIMVELADPTVQLANFDTANLLALFDGQAQTSGLTPEVRFNADGVELVEGGSAAVDLGLVLQSSVLGAAQALTIELSSVPFETVASADGTQLRVAATAAIQGSVRFGGYEIARFDFSNLDADTLLLTTGENAIPALGVKIDNLIQKAIAGPGDVIDIGALPIDAVGALAAAVFKTLTEGKSLAEVIALVRSVVTLPASLDTVGELAAFIQNSFTAPTLASLTIGDLLGHAEPGTGGQASLLLGGLALMADIAPTQTLSQVLSALQNNAGIAAIPLGQLGALAASVAGLIDTPALVSKLVAGLVALPTIPAHVDTAGELAAYLQDNVTALGVAQLTVSWVVDHLPPGSAGAAFIVDALGVLGLTDAATLSEVLSAIRSSAALQDLTLAQLASRLGGEFEGILPELVGAALDYLVTQRGIDTLGELIDFARDAVDAPALSGKTFGQVMALLDTQALGNDLRLVLDALMQVAGIDAGDTLVAGLDKALAVFPIEQIDLVTLETVLGQAMGGTYSLDGLVDDLAGMVFGVLGSSGVELSTIVTQLAGAVEDAGALRAALAAIDTQSLFGVDLPLADILKQIAEEGTIDLAHLLPIAARTFLGADGVMNLTMSGLDGLGIEIDGRPLDGLVLKVELGDDPTQETTWSYLHRGTAGEDTFSPLAGDTISGLGEGDKIDLGQLLQRFGYSAVGTEADTATLVDRLAGWLDGGSTLDGTAPGFGDNQLAASYQLSSAGDAGMLSITLDTDAAVGQIDLQTFSIALIATESGLTSDDLITGLPTA
ncbi:MAG: cadherin domain-containing protein [Thauera sp.]|nr:cadherin domain-containing protein [Thauera sp.]